EVGLQHRQAGRELWRGLREERGLGLAAQDRPRPEQAVDTGRPAVLAADPLSHANSAATTAAAPRGGGFRLACALLAVCKRRIPSYTDGNGGAIRETSVWRSRQSARHRA